MNYMELAVIISKQDKAGMNIASCLDEKRIKYYLQDKKSIYCENIDKRINADMFIFATKHESKAGVNSLSVHAPGNFGKAELGGKDKQLCVAPAAYLKKAMIELEKRKLEGFEVEIEQTHHGPYLEKPCMFIEIGSNEKAWLDKKAGNVIADVIEVLLNWKRVKYQTVSVLGGGHYNHVAKKILLKTDFAVNHICAKHLLKFLNKYIINQVVNKSTMKSEKIILDWKGLGKDKCKVIKLLNESNLKYERSKDFLKHSLNS